MIEYFTKKEQCEKLERIAKSWLNTPYHHMWHTKGRGADCSLFIAEVYKEFGILDEVNVADYYPTDWHINGNTHLLENTIETAKLRNGYRFKKVKDLKCGDLLIFTFISNRIPHHSALYLNDNQIIQAGKSGVALVDYDDRWKRHLVSMYRVVKW